MDQNVDDLVISRSIKSYRFINRRSRVSFGYSLYFLLLATSLCSSFGLNSEGFSLLVFKNAITKDPDNVLGNWNQNDSTPCAWNGVTCNSNKVVTLSLPRRRLLGTIPAELGNLTQLRQLKLHDNNLFGSLSPALFSGWTLLKILYLFDNNLSGILPSSVGQLVNLQRINIATNGFVGGVPVEISGCQKLQTLILRGNRFSGNIPDDLGNRLRGLQTLDLSLNELSGDIPAELGNLSSLQDFMNLSRNQLSGPIPESLANLPLSVTLDLSSNNLSGPIPPALARQDRKLTVDHNVGLCGAPLSNPCPLAPSSTPSPAPSPTVERPPTEGKQGLSKGVIIAIVLGDAAGILLMVLFFEFCIRKKSKCIPSKKGADAINSSEENSFDVSIDQDQIGCLCCAKTPAKIGSEFSEKIEPGELIRLDKDVKFDLEELLRASAYILGKSSSGAGIVYKAMLEDGLRVAVRRLGEGGALEYKEFEAEVQLIGKIRHPNIVSLRAYYWAVDEKLLVYDFIPNGSLATALHARTTDLLVREPLSWDQRLHIAQECARGLAYIHACGAGKPSLVHRDVKPSNILFDENMVARISDLGLPRLQSLAGGTISAKPKSNTALSRGSVTPASYSNVLPVTNSNVIPVGNSNSIPTSSTSSSTQGGIGRRSPAISACYVCPSMFYQPPEAADKPKPTQEWDVYAFGVVLLELLTGMSPPAVQVATRGEKDLVTWVRQSIEERKPVTDILDTHLSMNIRGVEGELVKTLQIALSCTEASPESRPPMSEVSNQLGQIGLKLEISDSDG